MVIVLVLRNSGCTTVYNKSKLTVTEAHTITLHPPPRTAFCRGPKHAGMFFLNDSQRKAAKFCLFFGFDSQRKAAKYGLFFGFEMNVDHCFGTGVDPPWMLISNELDSPLLLRSPALIDTGLYWSKIRSTLV